MSDETVRDFLDPNWECNADVPNDVWNEARQLRIGHPSAEYFVLCRRQLREALTTLAEAVKDRDEFERKALSLGAAYGAALIEIGNLERDPMISCMKLGIQPSPRGWFNDRAETAEASLKQMLDQLAVERAVVEAFKQTNAVWECRLMAMEERAKRAEEDARAAQMELISLNSSR